jgi:dephospho-CoA kinase
MIRAALTGGIASGKSTVGRMLTEKGCLILDADQMAHRLILPGEPCFQPVVDAFGSGLLNAEGQIDRAILGDRVFQNPSELSLLNQIIHPVVTRQILQQLAEYSQLTTPPHVMVEASVLFESGFDRDFDFIVVVACSEQQQLGRLYLRNGWSESKARSRLAAQWPLTDKSRLAHYIIDNSGTMENTRHQVDLLLDHLGWISLHNN